MRAAPLAVLALVLLSSSAGLAPGPGGEGFDGRSCDYHVAPVAGNAAAARRHVPAGFRILGEEAGVALVVVVLARCEFTVRGGGPDGGFVSDVGVAVAPPAGEAGLHLYLLWSLTDLPDLHAFLRGQGIAPSDLVDIELQRFGGWPFSTLLARVHWEPGGYGFTAGNLATRDRASGFAAVWWHEGAEGLVRIDQAFCVDEAARSTTAVATLRGSGPLGAILGGGEARTAMPVLRGDLAATFTRPG